jgi:hypothetical protein
MQNQPDKFLAAWLAGDSTALAQSLTPDFIHTTPEGAWQTRDAFLAALPARTAWVGEGAAQSAQTYTLGNSLVVQPTFATHRIHGIGALADFIIHRSLRTDAATGRTLRATDIFIQTPQGWDWASAQETPLQEGVAIEPSIIGPTAYAPWHGEPHALAPKSDITNTYATLVALNDQYVNAYREANASWYDAHLTPEYMAAQGNGALHGRAAALARFALPSFATTMKSFPVGRVNVRLYGIFACIDAENAYETKEGRKGISRYTDYWRKVLTPGPARWQCAGAHITPVA